MIVSRKQLRGVGCAACAGYLLLALFTAHAGVLGFEERTRFAVSLTHQAALDGPMRAASFLRDGWGLARLGCAVATPARLGDRAPRDHARHLGAAVGREVDEWPPAAQSSAAGLSQ